VGIKTMGVATKINWSKPFKQFKTFKPFFRTCKTGVSFLTV
jgi:hypothetical protein